MTMHVTVDVNGEPIAEMFIQNHGHPSRRGTPPDDDTRTYVVTVHADDRRTTRTEIVHRRSDGWLALLATAATSIDVIR